MIYPEINFLIQNSRFDLAEQKVWQALSQTPDDEVLYGLLGDIYLHKKNAHKALEYVNKGIGINPEYDVLYSIKARAYIQLDDYANAENAILKSLELDNEYAYYYGVLSVIYINQKRWNDAEVTARRGLEYDAEEQNCNNMLSIALRKLGRPDESFQRLQHQLAQDPNDEYNQTAMAYHYLSQKEVEKAKEHFAVALQSDPNNEYVREGMLSAVRQSNFLYRKLIEFSEWQEQFSGGKRWIFFVGIYIVVRLVPVLLPLYILFIFWTWFTPPLVDVIIYFDKYARHLNSDLALKLTRINIGLLLASFLVALSAILFPKVLLAAAFGLFIAIIPVHLFDSKNIKNHQYKMMGFATFFILCALAIIAFSMFNMYNATVAVSVILVIIALIFTWTV